MMRSISSPLRWALAGAVAAALTLSAGQVRAQDQAAIERLVQMNKKALDDFDMLEWDSAKRSLLEALVTGKKAGLENHPVMARTYIHLGAVYITGFKDHQKGLQSFVRALEIDPTIKLSKAMATPELNDAFAEAGRQVRSRGASGGESAPAPPPPAPPPPPPPTRRRAPVMDSDASEPAPPPRPARRPPPAASAEDDSGEPDLPVRIAALDCPVPDEVPPEKPVVVRCAVAASLPVTKVFLMYREPNKEDFTAVEMERTPKGWFQGKIPKKVVVGKSVQFYFEGRNDKGRPVVSNGRGDSPNLMLIREEAVAEEAEKAAPRVKRKRGAAEEDENPLEERQTTGPRLYLGKVDKSKIGLDTRYGKRKWWIGLGLGSGYGYAKGNGLEARQDLQSAFAPGLAWAGLGHLAPEVGYHLNPDLAVSIQGRFQYIPQPAQYSKFVARGAQSVLARLLMFTRQQQIRFYGSVMAGGGEGFRFTLFPDAARPTFKDTVLGGPVLAGVGGGVSYEVSNAVTLVLEVNGLAGFPTFSFVADFNAALQINIY
jgi:hypothetical protein